MGAVFLAMLRREMALAWRGRTDVLTGVVDDLVEALVERARELGYTALALHVFGANERAAAAYVRHGFTQVNPPSPACPCRSSR